METIRKPKTLSGKNDVVVKGDFLLIQYRGKEYCFAFTDISKRLSEAPQSARENFIVSPGGYGIHWSDVDEDLSVNGLLKDKVQD